MIRVNLLYSLHDRPGSVGSHVAEGARRFNFDKLTASALAVAVLTVVVIGWDVVSSNAAVAAANDKLVEQQRVETELAAVLKEQKELEQKIQSVEARIEAIKRLRSTQAGPSAVLEAIRERISNVSGIFLESITQKGGELEIKGSSTDEAVVTQFGRSLEFSSGLFSNLSIETQRKPVEGSQASTGAAPSTDKATPEVVTFIIKCAYTAGKGTQDPVAVAAVSQASSASSTGARPVPPPPQLAQTK